MEKKEINEQDIKYIQCLHQPVSVLYVYRLAIGTLSHQIFYFFQAYSITELKKTDFIYYGLVGGKTQPVYVDMHI
jgi:hypothetical protein